MFIRVEDQSRNLTIWFTLSQIVRSITLQMLRLYRLY